MTKTFAALVILLASTLLASTVAQAGTPLSMHVGEVRVLKLKPVDRVAVGASAVVSTSLLANGQLLVLAEEAGSSTVHIWFESGGEAEYDVTVVEDNVERSAQNINQILGDIPGVRAEQIGDTLVVRGSVPPAYGQAIKALMAKFPDAIDLTNPMVDVVRELLSGVEGIDVSAVGENVVLRGSVDPGDLPILQTVIDKYAQQIMNLTTSGGLSEEKMVLMNIKITEFNKNMLETLGISWDNPVAGPSAALAVDVVQNNNFRVTPDSPSFSDGLQLGFNSAAGYFGIATEISSRINFLVNTGDALILAEPRLSTRSGGTATFLAGGELPLPVTGSLGQANVEFKEFGIRMEVAPIVDAQDRILATVSTELSAIDNSVAVNNIPGFLTRKTETDVSMNGGETLVISGLLDQQASKDVQKLKLLGDLPILGNFFRNKNVRNVERELVIFLTPTVYDAHSEINQRYIQRERDNIQEFLEAVDEKRISIIE